MSSLGTEAIRMGDRAYFIRGARRGRRKDQARKCIGKEGKISNLKGDFYGILTRRVV